MEQFAELNIEEFEHFEHLEELNIEEFKHLEQFEELNIDDTWYNWVSHPSTKRELNKFFGFSKKKKIEVGLREKSAVRKWRHFKIASNYKNEILSDTLK